MCRITYFALNQEHSSLIASSVRSAVDKSFVFESVLATCIEDKKVRNLAIYAWRSEIEQEADSDSIEQI